MTSFTASAAGISFALKDNPELKHLEIREDEEIILIPEPENEYDPKAIRLEYNGNKIGYVPKKKEGVDFSIQSWCHDNIEKVKAKVDQVWYKDGEEVTADYSPEFELAGIYINFLVPDDGSSENDLIITKTSFSEPDIIVDFNDTKHIYNMRCADGSYKVLKGGTTFIKRFYKPFDSSFISKVCAKSWGVSEEKIEEMWNSNGTLAASFGSVIHAALEHFINFGEVGRKITKVRKAKGGDSENYAMPKHPFLKKTIKSLKRMTDKLDKAYGVKEVVAEALVTDSETGWGGLVDRLVILDHKKKIARVQDYKVNIGAEKEESHSKPLPPFAHLPANKLTKYALQMSFYAGILKKHGWQVDGLDVFVFEDKWVHYELDLIDFSILKGKKS